MAVEQQLPKIKLVRIAHVYYTHSDLNQARLFLLDFGFQVAEDRGDSIYFKGYGTEPFVYCATKGESNTFGGAGFVVESLADLEVASKTLPKATPIEDSDAPGGGKRVTFRDPVDNFPFHLVYGQTPVERSVHLPELDYNFPEAKHRAVNKTQRFKKGPAPVHKLGHFGCCVTDFAKAFEFYTTRFNLKPSDLIHDEKGRDVTTFLHLDRGMEQVDHHTFFFFEGRYRDNVAIKGTTTHMCLMQVQNTMCTTPVSRCTTLTSRRWGTSGCARKDTTLSGESGDMS